MDAASNDLALEIQDFISQNQQQGSADVLQDQVRIFLAVPSLAALAEMSKSLEGGHAFTTEQKHSLRNELLVYKLFSAEFERYDDTLLQFPVGYLSSLYHYLKAYGGDEFDVRFCLLVQHAATVLKSAVNLNSSETDVATLRAEVRRLNVSIRAANPVFDEPTQCQTPEKKEELEGLRQLFKDIVVVATVVLRGVVKQLIKLLVDSLSRSNIVLGQVAGGGEMEPFGMRTAKQPQVKACSSSSRAHWPR